MIAEAPVPLRFPTWAAKLLRRLVALEDGRYMVVLTRAGSKADWSVTRLGKVEQPD